MPLNDQSKIGLANRFGVVVDQGSFDLGSWQKCEGLDVTWYMPDYRAGDELWCDTLQPEDFARALNRDVLVPRPAGRFVCGRLINRDAERLQVLPLETGGRQQVISNPPWIAVASKLVRAL